MAEFDGDNAYRILESIAHERLAATDGERQAAETLAGHLRGFGLEPELETFRMWTYVNDEARLEVLKPYRKSYEAAVVGLSGETPEGGIECGFAYVEDGSSQYLADVKGKALLLSRGPDYDKAHELIEKGAAALITASAPHLLQKRKAWREQMRVRVGKVPSMDITFEDALELVKKKASRVRLHVKQEEREGVSQNVVAEIPGTAFPDEVIACVAHYDGVSKSVGGHDNASGAAIIAEVARCVAEAPLKRTVRVVLCGGEEMGLYGSRAYVAKHKDEMRNVRLCVNCDVAGAIFGMNRCYVTGPETLRWYLDAMGKEYGMGYITVSTDAYSSDNVPFSHEGVPAASIARYGGYVSEGHTSRDGYEDIDGDHLAITGRFILGFLRRAGDAVVFPFEREIADEAKKKLERYVERMRGEHYKPLKKLKKKN